MARVRNPLEPMSTAVTSIVTLIAVLMGVSLFSALFVDGVHVLGIGDESVCVMDTSTTVGVGDEPARVFEHVPGATVGLSAHPDYCTESPSLVQSLLNTTTRLAPFVFTVGALLLVLRLIRSAKRDGLYTVRTARQLHRLGWWLLAGSVLAAMAVSTAEKALIDSLSRADDISVVSGLWMWDAPFMAILTGLGVLSFARIMRVGIVMREDLDGTV
ncbi:DUF2975 domain-containing protein [Streptomyces sp. NPDC093094]|uniref:DUF2975 domain-containing protein n=1 Tax=Streptomyces sp. NPDC093094 TaxID=3366026 RepID=UPI0037FA0F22